MVKRLPAMRESWVWSLGQEDPLGKEMASHSSTLAWKIPWTEETGRLQSMWSQRVRHDWVTDTFTFHGLLCIRNHFFFIYIVSERIHGMFLMETCYTWPCLDSYDKSAFIVYFSFMTMNRTTCLSIKDKVKQKWHL